MLTYADVCGRVRMYADVCGRMLTYADVYDVLARQKQPLTWLEGIAHELAKVRPHALVFFF
jgi:hypothetical protein